MAPRPIKEVDNSLRWDLLSAQAPSGERLTVRIAIPARRNDVFIGVDSAQRRYVLVEIPPGEPTELAERTSRGIAVQAVEMDVGGGLLRNFVEVACLEPQGHPALDIVVTELVDALDGGASIGRVRLVQNVLAKWRRFWSSVSQGLLSREQQLGLFGELWFLSHWLTPSVGASTAVHMWRGPLGARNDFEVSHVGIEVKTTARLDESHVIHGLEQLLEPSGGSLFLFSLVVRDEASGMEALPNLVAAVRTELASDYAALSQFDSALYASGYEDQHAPEYAKLVLRVRSQGLYRVTGQFPRLVPESIAGGLPQGVDGVTYELRLMTASPWMVASAPAAALSLLADFAK